MEIKSLGRRLAVPAIAALMALGGGSAHAATIIANTVLDFFDSGAGPLTGPYGGTFPGSFPDPVPLSFATDGDSTTFVSLPTGSYIDLGFTSGFIFDGPGNDIFVSEPGDAMEVAEVYVSSDFGVTFTFLGLADGGTLTELDLADIGYMGIVNAIRIVGLDNLGGSPGFDVAFVQGLEGSSVVPVPAAAPLMLAGLGGLAFLRRRRREPS